MLRGNPALSEIVPIDTRGWRRVRAAARHRRGGRRGGRAAAATCAPNGSTWRSISRDWSRAAWSPPRPGRRSGSASRRRLPRATQHALHEPARDAAPVGASRRRPVPRAARARSEYAPRSVEFPLPTDAGRRGAGRRVRRDATASSRSDRLVVLNPGAGRPDKRWPIARFRDLARRLVDDAGAAVLVIWGPNELDDARAIVAGARPVGCRWRRRPISTSCWRCSAARASSSRATPGPCTWRRRSARRVSDSTARRRPSATGRTGRSTGRWRPRTASWPRSASSRC